jgi:pyrroline-5-carboxylate reductase
MKTIGFIGGGRITKIFLQAFKNEGITFNKVVVFDTNTDILDSLKSKFPQIVITKENLQEVVKNELVILALHPPVMIDMLEKIKDNLDNGSMLISLAPKITIEKMGNILNGFTNIARMNPSASTIVNKGVNPISFSKEISDETKRKVIALLQPFGFTPEVEESKIEAYAVISAMGHTYFWFQLQQLKELALSFGLTEKEAQKTITEMLQGTTETLFNSGLSFEEVVNLVPVKPMAEHENAIKEFYKTSLNNIYQKIKP